MTGILDLSADSVDLSATDSLKALPRTLGERVEATAAETFSPGRYFMAGTARRDLWQRAVDELQATTGEALPNPYAPMTQDEMRRLRNQGAIAEERQQKIIEASRLARANGADGLFDPENIDRYIGEEDRRRRQRAAELEGTGNGIGNFVAGIGMAAVEPVNILALGLPVTRLPTAAARALGETFVVNVAREAGLQAAANLGTQAVTEALDYTTRSQFGTEASGQEIATNILAAGAFGGVLGGGVRALHLKWLGLPEKVRAEAPLEVRDAFKVIEAETLYSGQNRLGVDPLLHERYQGRAYDAILRATPISADDLSRTADMPMTAMATILRQVPERIEPAGLQRAAARVAALPDAELEPFARQIKPTSFTALDRVNDRLKALDDRIEAIHREADQIGVADVADPETAAILRDIEERLQQPALRKAQREKLLHERAQWIETLDVGGGLTEALKQGRRDVFPEHLPALREIAAERAKLQKELTIAQGEAQREVDFLRGKLDKIETGEPDGPVSRETLGAEPVDVARALEAAEFDRMARIFREVVPGGAVPRTEATPSQSAAATTPEAAKALNAETARLVGKHADMEVEIDGKVMSATKAMEEADRLDREAAIASNCAFGSL